MTVQPIEHTDVRGNIMYYLRISNHGKDYLMNVGKKTFDTVTEMQNSQQTKLPLDEVDNKNSNSRPRNGRDITNNEKLPTDKDSKKS